MVLADKFMELAVFANAFRRAVGFPNVNSGYGDSGVKKPLE